MEVSLFYVDMEQELPATVAFYLMGLKNNCSVIPLFAVLLLLFQRTFC